MPAKLTEVDFKEAAKILKCDVPAIKAVAEVESSGDGFLSDGRIKVLFEGHWFFKYTDGKYATSHPTICFPKWTKEHYTKGANDDVRGAGELARLQTAMGLDKKGALLSASYGKFQIMGFNFAICGFTTIESFYQDMLKNELEHLKAFCGYINGNALDRALREHDWAALAYGYNGKDYRHNRYDEKLANAYKKYAAQPAS